MTQPSFERRTVRVRSVWAAEMRGLGDATRRGVYSDVKNMKGRGLRRAAYRLLVAEKAQRWRAGHHQNVQQLDTKRKFGPAESFKCTSGAFGSSI